MTEARVPNRWWVSPLLFTLALIIAVTAVCMSSETAREVLAKAVMMIAGALATPFILETSVFLIGLVIVIALNQWRMQKEGDGWVYLAQTEPDPASIAAGAETPSKRLEGIILTAAPDARIDLEARLSIAEGFLDLGLKDEAVEHLNLLSAEEQKDPRAVALRQRVAVP
ncbi:hypothetical protein WJU23_14960 [Prosthecobacter sp. SYSU 5D2]|uniref:hypothetical protein n=1 Tax=Prosthecobacter sp. SYSU 5D2 TaxID=3134134 RepID=UPI0031FEFAE2